MGISVSPTESPFLDVPPNPPSHYSPHTATRSMTPRDICGSASGDIENAISSNSHDDSSIGNPVDLDAITQTPLQLGETLIIYHPHSQHPPEVINTALLSLTREPQHPLLPEEPWAPFASRDDFEQAELFIKHNCTNRLINDQLHLNQKRDAHNCDPGDPPPMKNAREMHRILEEAGSDLDVSSVC